MNHSAVSVSEAAAASNPLAKTLAIVGQPNVGKSVIFHALTGKYVAVSNFPGTTVDLSSGVGRFDGQEWRVTDTPGVVSLHARTDDERVARDCLLQNRPDVVVQVADAKNLAKALHITLELSEFGLPVVLVLNMSDERQDRGLAIDVPRLSTLLGIPVVETVAISGDGIPALKSLLKSAAVPAVKPRYDRALFKAIETVESHLPDALPGRRAVAVALLAGEKTMRAQIPALARPGEAARLEEAVDETRRRFARPPEMLVFESKQHIVQEVTGEVLSSSRPGQKSWLSRLGLLCMRPFPGYLVAIGALWVLYEFVGVFGAGVLVNYLEKTVFGVYINPAVTRLVHAAIPIPLIQDVLVGEYGAITMALTYALALILPIVTTFFLFFGFLEDSGYLPRLAVMMDRLFRLMGLNGRAILPMVLGLGCDTMATVTTRILDTKKEKIILSLLLTLAVPCSAQLGAILGMSAGVSWHVLAIWFTIISATMLTVGWGAGKLLPGARSPFLVDLPPLRMPKLSNIFKKVKMRLKWYIKEVIPLFVVATFVLFALDKLGLLSVLTNLVSPIVVQWLGLPAKASEAFLIGFFRRDYGAAGFFQMANSGLLSTRQVAVSMVVITLFMPCIAHLLITIKERGWKAATAIATFVMIFALVVGGALNWILKITAFV